MHTISTEIKKAAAENSPDLKEILKSVRDKDITPQCYQEALLAAARMGHLDAISVIVLVGCKENLRLKECIREAVQFHFYSAAALLLVCYAAKHVKKELLKYLMGLQLQDEEKDAALADLPYKPVLQLNMEQMRWDKKIGSSIHAHTYTHARTHTRTHARTHASLHGPTSILMKSSCSKMSISHNPHLL